MIWINSIIGHITSSLLPMSSREYKTIVRCASQFTTALHSDRDIPHHLHADGFLTREIYDDVISPRCICSLSRVKLASLLVASGGGWSNLRQIFP